MDVAAPRGVVRKLARHEDANVAGPVLAKSSRLSDDDLMILSEGMTELLHVLGIDVPGGAVITLEHVNPASKRVTQIAAGHTLILRVSWMESPGGKP